MRSADYRMYSTFLTSSPGSVLFSRSNLLKRKDLCFSFLRLGLIRYRRSLRSSHLSSQVGHDSHRVTLEKLIFYAPDLSLIFLESLEYYFEHYTDYRMYSTFLTTSSGSVLFSRSNLLKRKDLCFSCLRLGLIRYRRSLRSSHLSSQVCHDSHRVTLEPARPHHGVCPMVSSLSASLFHRFSSAPDLS